MMKWRVKGVYTVEAAILIPFTCFVMAAGIRIGIDLYTVVRDEASEYEAVLELDEVKTVHHMRAAGTIWKAIGGNEK